LRNSSSNLIPLSPAVNYEVDGNPYLFEKWNNRGFVFWKDSNKAIKLAIFNYNASTNQFETKVNEDSTSVFTNSIANSIAINN
jgi:hypothetical protein